jgi:hypothetical protein
MAEANDPSSPAPQFYLTSGISDRNEYEELVFVEEHVTGFGKMPVCGVHNRK